MTNPVEANDIGNEIGVYAQNSDCVILLMPWSVPEVFHTQRNFVCLDAHVSEGEALISDITMRGPPFLNASRRLFKVSFYQDNMAAGTG